MFALGFDVQAVSESLTVIQGAIPAASVIVPIDSSSYTEDEAVP
jgi:hypothetical protein